MQTQRLFAYNFIAYYCVPVLSRAFFHLHARRQCAIDKYSKVHASARRMIVQFHFENKCRLAKARVNRNPVATHRDCIAIQNILLAQEKMFSRCVFRIFYSTSHAPYPVPMSRIVYPLCAA